MNKPKLSITITSLSDETITKTYTKANGLKSITINGVSNSVPSYGIMSRSGSLEIIDSDGWLREQSDNNILPDVSVSVSINGAIVYTSKSNNDIEYILQDKSVRINLSDSIVSLQDSSFNSDIIFSDTNGYLCAIDLFSKLGIYVSIGKEEEKKLKAIYIDSEGILIKADTYWNILQQFLNGVFAIMYSLGGNYYIKVIKE